MLPKMQTPEDPAESHHDLYIRAGSGGFYFRNDNHGVTLTDERISWRFNGQDDGAPFTNIRAVHLQSGGGDWTSPTNMCRITFADAYTLLITDADDRGTTDPARRPVYAAFLLDLHKRLAALPQDAIRFTSGYQGFRYPLIIACAIALGFICVVLPVVIMITKQTFEPIMVLFAGIGLYWPLAKAIEKNTPRSYDPRALPADFLEA